MISLRLALVDAAARRRSAGRSRARTSCWVMVEPPRSLPWIVSIAAETNPSGSKPALSQKVLSSIGRRGVDQLRRDLVEGHELPPVRRRGSRAGPRRSGRRWSSAG